MGFSRQEYWSGVPLPSLVYAHYIYKYKDAIYMYKDVGDANDSIFFMHLSLNGHLSCFHVLAIVSSAFMIFEMHVSF